MDNLILTAKKKLPQLFQDYVDQNVDKKSIDIILNEATQILTKYNLHTIRETKSQHSSTLLIKDRIERVSAPINKAIAAASKLDEFTKKELALALNIKLKGKIDLVTLLKEIKSACDLTIAENTNPKKSRYYTPLNQAFKAFHNYRFDFENKTVLATNETHKKLDDRDWEFFKELISIAAHIIIVESEIKRVEGTNIEKINDTRKALQRTLEAIKGKHAEKFIS